MATVPNSRCTEIRTPLKGLVELCSFENVTSELAYTVGVSSHGARVLRAHPSQCRPHAARARPDPHQAEPSARTRGAGDFGAHVDSDPTSRAHLGATRQT